MTVVESRSDVSVGTTEKVGVIDCDVHPEGNPARAEILAYLPTTWQRRVQEYGLNYRICGDDDRPRHREFAHRWDAVLPDGGAPASDPRFAAAQHLDRYDISGALLNDIGAFRNAGAGGQPADFSVALCRAMNEHRRDSWLASDPRWYGSISVPYEVTGEKAAEEIRHCKEDMGEYNDRWKQVLLAPDNTRPAGNQSYWPMYEAAEHYGMPIGFHVLSSHRITPSGVPNYYFEEHNNFALFNFHTISSLIFEGVFERFPKLKFTMIELAWSWAVPFAWRLDNAYKIHRSEVPHLTKLPSEYLAEHFYYTTQPLEEPEKRSWFDDVLSVFESSGMSRRLMYSSDYPHWDFDEPNVLPGSLGLEQKRRILGTNAQEHFGIPLKPNSGITVRR